MGEYPSKEHRFKKGNPGGPGRKPKAINIIGEAIGIELGIKIDKRDKLHLIEWCLEKTKADLKEIVEDESSPVFLVSIAAAILYDIKKGQISTVDSLFNRLFGKPAQSTHVSGSLDHNLVVEWDDTEK